METFAHQFSELFQQLGLPSDPASIAGFISQHARLSATIKLADAPFWTLSQAGFLREAIQEDADWAEIIDTLNSALR